MSFERRPSTPAHDFEVVDHTSADTTYYVVKVTHISSGDEWTVEKRYKEFETLKCALDDQGCPIPSFPRKHLVRSNFDAVIEERKTELTVFLREVCLKQEHNQLVINFLDLDKSRSGAAAEEAEAEQADETEQALEEDIERVRREMLERSAEEQAGMFRELDQMGRIEFVSMMTPEQKAALFGCLDPTEQKQLLSLMSPAEMAAMFTAMDDGQRAALLEALDIEGIAGMFTHLDPALQEALMALLEDDRKVALHRHLFGEDPSADQDASDDAQRRTTLNGVTPITPMILEDLVFEEPVQAHPEVAAVILRESRGSTQRSPAEMAEWLWSLDPEQRAEELARLSAEERAALFGLLSSSQRAELLAGLSTRERGDLIVLLDSEMQDVLMETLSEDERDALIHYLNTGSETPPPKKKHVGLLEYARSQERGDWRSRAAKAKEKLERPNLKGLNL